MRIYGPFYRIGKKKNVYINCIISNTFLVIVQLILMLYFQKVLEYMSSPQICHYRNSNNLIRRVILTY